MSGDHHQDTAKLTAMLPEDLAEFDDWNDDDIEEPVTGLLVDKTFSSIAEMATHHLSEYGFDLVSLARSVGDRFDKDMGMIMLINFVRSSVANGVSPADISDKVRVGTFLQDEGNMTCVMTDDNLLVLMREFIYGDDDDDESLDGTERVSDVPPMPPMELSSSSSSSSSARTATEVEQLRAKLAQYQRLVDDLVNAPDREREIPMEGEDAPLVRADDYYFESYAGISIHETMLRDVARTETYKRSMIENSDFFKGKVVLDVGCGTGILSMCAARAGAKKVVGVDESSILDYTRKIVKANGLDDVITLVHGRIEETQLPLVEDEVDIIVSEWMGYGLFYENMFPSVIFARDTLMKEGGLVLPSSASLFFETLSVVGDEDRVGWWGDVYSFDMTALKPLMTKDAQVQLAEAEDISSDRCCMHKMNLNTASDEDLDFTVPFKLTMSRSARVNAFVLSFDCGFGGKGMAEPELVLSTAVQAEPTHWKQSVLWLDDENAFDAKEGQTVAGTVHFLRSAKNRRDYHLDCKWTWADEQKTQMFKLES